MRAEKQNLSTEYLSRLNASPFFIVVDYRGLKVGPITDLRKRLARRARKCTWSKIPSSAARPRRPGWPIWARPCPGNWPSSQASGMSPRRQGGEGVRRGIGPAEDQVRLF